MLLEFTVGNFLSFKEPVTLSLETATISEFPEHTFSAGRYQLLKSAVIYGANASGKTNLIEAISWMRQIVRSSASMSSTDGFEVVPFLLHPDTANQPCFFEILFLLNQERYRYGFELSPQRVHTEWLYQAKVKAEKLLFIRHGHDIELSPKFAEGKGLAEKTRENALFLAVCDQFNGPIARRIMEWFNFCNTISGLHHQNYRLVTSEMLQHRQYRPAILQFLAQLDLGFVDVRVEEQAIGLDQLLAELPLPQPQRMRLTKDMQGLRKLVFKSQHDIYGPNGEKIGTTEFDLDTQESSGTNKIFDLLGPFFDTLALGRILVVDELDAKLHPLLTQALVRLFHDPNTNPRNAQLIFATHDTNLLSYSNFRRDQIYFVEKNQQGATSLYSLVEYQENGIAVRKDRSFEPDYIQGRYGAIPYLGDFSKIFNRWPATTQSPTT